MEETLLTLTFIIISASIIQSKFQMRLDSSFLLKRSIDQCLIFIMLLIL